eukprot:gene33707-43565_t
MNVDEKCFEFRDSIRAGLSYRYSEESDKDDMMYLHILDCIGALSRIQKRSGKMYLKTENRNKYNPLAESKRRIFWQAVRELADQEILLANKKDKKSSEINSAQSRVLDVFPDEAKRLDGRSWLPLHWAVSLPNTDIQDIENLIIARPEAVKICISSSGFNPMHLACMANARVEVIAEENIANLTVMMDDGHCDSVESTFVAHIAVRFEQLDILRYIQSVKPELLLSEDSIEDLPISYMVYDYLSSPMSVASEILRFLLHHCRSIIPEKAVGRDPFGYKAFYRALSDAEKEGLDLDLQYPRRLLLLAGHPSLCLPEVLRDLNYSARRGALFLFFHHHLPNPPPPAPSSTHTATGATIFWRIRDGPGSKETIRAITGFL